MLVDLNLKDFMMDKGNDNALSDIEVGVNMAFAGLEGAIMSVEINLPSIKWQIDEMERRGQGLREIIHSFVKGKLKS